MAPLPREWRVAELNSVEEKVQDPSQVSDAVAVFYPVAREVDHMPIGGNVVVEPEANVIDSSVTNAP